MIEQDRNYEKVLQQQLHDLKITNKPIVLFGVMAAGLIAKKVLDDLNITISCFCDNNKQKQGREVEGLMVLSVDQVKEKYPDAKICICSHNHDNIIEIKKQLLEIGFRDVHSNDIFSYQYNCNFINRNASNEDYIDTLNKCQSSDSLIIKKVAAFITEKCTLRCINCNIYVPYYKNPKHHNKELIINSVKTLAKSVDVIENLAISGGEPFTHPELEEICEEISKIKNIKTLVLVTNGTIIPSEKTLERIGKCIHYISISNYGKYSREIIELIKELRRHGITYELFDESSQWFEMKIPKKQGRSIGENNQLFKQCEILKSSCSFIINGQYHLCQISAASAPFNLVLKNEDDYVNLNKPLISDDELRKKIHILLNKKDGLAACDYCELHKRIPVLRAQQTNKVLELE